MTPEDITVVIPTFNRPDSLHRAVESLFWQGARKSGFRVLIVDNSADASARMAFDTLESAAPDKIKLTYLHAPAAGVANARNAAMDRLETTLVAFLDDDQTAPIHWIEGLVSAYEEFGAAVTFGPVLTAMPEDIKKHRAYFENFFAREPALRSGYIEKPYGCGNSLLDTAQIPGEKPWFDARMNEVGGEDDVLFARIAASDGRFAWAANAPVYEHPLRQRISLSYTLRRALAYGQGPCTLARKADPPRYGSLLMWMAIGAGKFVLHGTIWLGMFLIRHPRRAFQLDKAVRGLGKVLFWIEMKFYGNATVSQAKRADLPRPQETRVAARRDETSATN
ncbi:glycosyltransferase family 2 protein [Henriciella litoralis]|uniref:glycosyltransferase family 2 protein n=1 Tax=Henriciella litoralis TaxID=568102 RepID=UPI0009FC8394|nr:glycosyltransferase family 2 protein [Henriciella litoralis]